MPFQARHPYAKRMSELPRTPYEAMIYMAELLAELDILVLAIKAEDRIATILEEDYLEAYSKAWKATHGTAEAKKQMAISLTREPRQAWKTAVTEVRNLRTELDGLKSKINVAQSYGTNIRAEIELSKSPFNPYGA